MKKICKILCFILLCGCILSFYGCEKKIPTNTTGLLQAVDNYLLDNNDNKVSLRGVNAGGWLVQEGWMGFTKMNADDSVEVSQTLILQTLEQRFGEEKTEELLDAFLTHYWTEEDFANVAKLGFNVIRLPFTYLNLLDEDYQVKEDAFYYLDWFVDNCAKFGLYCILDCHGAVGSQNGQHHSGDYSQAELFNNESYMNATLNMWVKIAEHYKDNATIAGYDLLNEPEGGLRTGKTTSVQWNYYDRIFDAVRAMGDNHIIIMESCWEQSNLPRPTKYDWTNVMYEYHYYNWTKPNSEFVNWLFVNSKVLMDKFANYNVPVLIGEFTFFDNAKCWDYGLGTFNKQGWNWTVWNYKTNRAGAWGLYQANVDKVDVSSASYEQILAVWSNTSTNNCLPTDTLTATTSKLGK